MGLHTPVDRVGWPDRFIEHGKVEALRAKYGLTAEAALKRLRPLLGLREPQPSASGSPVKARTARGRAT